ncbi:MULTISPECIES: glutamine--fructose-6-phosphate transaminase (isomerizing) [unclassified Gemella]|uniref:glutamine--fructose-6-phosphate transaminase (isomerizing) n=1 Tax=unclassified Gemella TaxID=2624949 RepID=UPI0015D035D6|nr:MULTISPECIES: glutamine--fructose-6-phosphate transaminase (isomerizing) [unclassified Gemella]MBF0709956.1 glutamine--fructose-6-phosphate transaminase (isomerizing) [Gemella sp. GL1.1]NYS27300.1 glutamine--fructose-6-phosphate transaminase (isomerizing) [Gemella sp. GL1]
MCGIVGFIGKDNGVEFLIDGLNSLEYRGYDSCGIAGIVDEKTKVIKTVGRIKNLEELTSEDLVFNIGIGHTRWATHGGVNKTNSHPHQSFNERFTLVHNGVIENFSELKEEFLSDKKMISETDTEVVVQLIEVFAREGLSTKEAFLKTISKLHGSYALCLIDREDADTLYVAKNKSPLLIGLGQNCNYVGSDALAMIKYTNKFLEINDGELVTVKADSVLIEDKNGVKIERSPFTPNIKYGEIDKGVYEHYMIKEINEQAFAMRNIISEYFDGHDVKMDQEIIDAVKEADRLYVIGCGTSYNAGQMSKEYFEKWAGIPTELHLASEFAYNLPLLSKKPMFIFLSQSGETADLRAVLTKLREVNPTYKVLVLTNVDASTLSRESDYTLLLHAGVEIAVASTKAYTSQIAVLSILAYQVAKELGKAPNLDLEKELSVVTTAIESILDDTKEIKELTDKLFTERNAFYIGRGADYYSSCEAALKLKEVSYIQTEGFAGGELKHGTIALIEDNIPVVALITKSEFDLSTRSNVSEVASRGAKTLVITLEKLAKEGDYAIPNVHETLAPIVSIVVTQLFAYYAALGRGLDVDKPRNLAKSVTVE